MTGNVSYTYMYNTGFGNSFITLKHVHVCLIFFDCKWYSNAHIVYMAFMYLSNTQIHTVGLQIEVHVYM